MNEKEIKEIIKEDNITFSEFKRINKTTYFTAFINNEKDSRISTKLIKLDKRGGSIQAFNKYCKTPSQQLKQGLRTIIENEKCTLYIVDKELEKLSKSEKLMSKILYDLDLKQNCKIEYKSIIVKSKNKKYLDTAKLKFATKWDEKNEEPFMTTKFFRFDNIHDYLKSESKNDVFELLKINNTLDLKKMFNYNSNTEYISMFKITKVLINKISNRHVVISYKPEIQQILFQTNKTNHNEISDLPFLCKKPKI